VFYTDIKHNLVLCFFCWNIGETLRPFRHEGWWRHSDFLHSKFCFPDSCFTCLLQTVHVFIAGVL